MSVCFFYLAQNARAEVSIIGSSGSKIKIEKIAVFDEPWALTFINENDLLVSTKKGKLWLVNEDGKKSSIDGLPDITYGVRADWEIFCPILILGKIIFCIFPLYLQKTMAEPAERRLLEQD